MTQVAEKVQSRKAAIMPMTAALERRPTGGPRWLEELRRKAASRFADLGFPTVRDEEW